ncbi:MAG: hypothetical protein QM768_18725 [Agriterribacter sp.]
MRIYFNGVSARFFVLIFCLISLTGWSQTVGSWNFNNTLNGTAAANTTTSPASLSAAIPSGAYNGGTVYYGEDGWPTGAINTNMYLQFTVTPNAGYALNLTAVEMNIRRSTTGSPSGAGPRQWSLRSSVDGYAVDLGAGAIALNTTPTITVSLGLAFQNLMTPVTFRLYGYDVFNNPGGLNRFVYDNIAIKGLMLLPIHFTALTGKSTAENNTSLYWSVDQYSTINYFEVERSDNGTSFFTSDKLYRQETTDYTFTDSKTITGSFVWYRIKSTELNGTITYSDILKLQVQHNGVFTINKITTTGGQIIAQVNTSSNGAAKIILLTMDGKIIAQQNNSLVKGTQTIQFNHNNTPGIQILTIMQNGQIISRQFVN